MAFVDEITLHLKAGAGGNGIVSWLHEKGKEFMGPAGGDGGKGGDVYLRAVRDIGRLASYRYGNLFVAGRADSGQRKSRHGKNGKDLELEVPVGSVVTNKVTGRVYEFLNEGERYMVLRGGRGGLGNEHFKSSRNVRPMEFTLGKAGEEAEFYVELRLIADAGLIGFPNAGKSSLLNELTAARAKVGSYAFTTLEPNLGAFRGFILADIPGLIEGAGEGKGLGTKFLRHIARTKLLLHCISLEEKSLLRAYKTVRDELTAHAPELAKKQEVIVLTKADMREAKDIKKAITVMKKKSKHVRVVSVIDDVLLKKFRDALVTILKEF
ncbi:MAG TPA: GTPase ObgE [Candidatus Taylorbacteria bacterium]|nr:MAG: GTPase obg [Parcubacteria group bacterium GW2011_GWA2_47_64]KKU96700.1 MAG: GTPase obg [Parcubacteria group bacterium GW2011_GWC2_48_17]HBV00792.1 GTPase ObgE [Candidatus Taylorbacteria bacterium]